MFLVADDKGRFRLQPCRPIQRLPEQGFAAEIHELFGITPRESGQSRVPLPPHRITGRSRMLFP